MDNTKITNNNPIAKLHTQLKVVHTQHKADSINDDKGYNNYLNPVKKPTSIYIRSNSIEGFYNKKNIFFNFFVITLILILLIFVRKFS